MRTSIMTIIWMGVLLAGWAGPGLSGEAAPAAVPAAGKAASPDPYRDEYADYVPPFIQMSRDSKAPGFYQNLLRNAKEMGRSSEKAFFTLNLLNESPRVDALIAAGIQKESEGLYREALSTYERLYDQFIKERPDMLYRVSEFGVYVPAWQYVQRRILNFPAEHLEFYRTKYDATAREAFEQARRNYSLIGYSEIVGSMLATSYGDDALITLGYSALDRGQFLEALEHFEAAWEYFPETRARDPELITAVALCRKMLGLAEMSGERYQLLGHWKMDETGGNTAADSAGNGVDGAVAAGPSWTPGKVGGALRMDMTNGVSIPESGFLDIGQGDSDFSVALWVWLDGERREYPPDSLFMKRSQDRKTLLHLGVKDKGNRIEFGLDTEHPQRETGKTETGVGSRRWTHVAFVRAGREARLYIDGKRVLRQPLKGRGMRIPGPITLGGLQGMVDDVRLYGRALLDREVAAFAGTEGVAAVTAAPAAGEAPLKVTFSAGAAAGECAWEFGDGRTAVGPKATHTYGLGGDYTAVLTVTAPSGSVAVGRAKVSVKDPPGEAEHRRRMAGVLAAAGRDRHDSAALPTQSHSPGCVGTDDYRPLPPSTDPLVLKEPVWRMNLTQQPLRGGVVYSHPVVTRNSVIYRHKNIVTCRSILNGEARWENDLGGQATWQNPHALQFAQEDLVVQDGLVFTPMLKVGPSLVALDEMSGELKWAHGPMALATPDEAKMRFEAAPAGGPLAVYAGYILDEIEGDTHTDTEYGIMAFESATGRILWRTPVCRLTPGKFVAAFARTVRSRIRSFASPPLYHEGTVYYNSNAGAIGALDARSGRVKWMMRYPYHDRIHDTTRDFYAGSDGKATGWHRTPSLWYPQRPLIVGENLYMLPVDGPMLLCLDRRTGKVRWLRDKAQWHYGPGAHQPCEAAYFMGPVSTGELLLVNSGRSQTAQLIDAKTGIDTWTSPEFIVPDDHPVMKHTGWEPYGMAAIGINGVFMRVGAKPLLDTNDRLYVPDYGVAGLWGWGLTPGYFNQHTVIDLREKKVLAARRHYDAETVSVAGRYIEGVAPAYLKELEAVVVKSKELNEKIQKLKEICADTPPVNDHGPFLPVSRVTFERSGVPFELRMTPRDVAMVFDPEAVKRTLAEHHDPDAQFAKAELAYAEARYADAARLLNQCLATMSSEDVDFRRAVNQQLFKVYQRLTRGAIRAGRKAEELEGSLGMNRTATTLGDEIDSLFAAAGALERQGDRAAAARGLRNIASFYGDYEYPVPSVLGARPAEILKTSEAVLDRAGAQVKDSLHGRLLARSAARVRQGLPLYLSAVTPLQRDLAVRADDLAAERLMRLQKQSPEVAAAHEAEAARALAGRPVQEQIALLREYPATPAAQKALDRLMNDAARAKDVEGRRLLWRLADMARVNGLTVADAHRARTSAPPHPDARGPLDPAAAPHERGMEDERSTEWMVLERGGDRSIRPELLFVGGRIKKRFDNKFTVLCLDQKTGEPVWTATEKRGETWMEELRLDGKGQEPGFFEAFVHGDQVVVCGMFDVLSFGLADGKLRWRYRVPFNFEIRHTLMSGDMMILGGDAETLALYVPTDDPRGEVMWEEKELGDLYGAPFLHGDRVVSVRKMPFGVTVRYRTTGRLMGRLSLPDLSQNTAHPILGDSGPAELPVAHDGNRLVVTDGWYYILVDVEKLGIVWKRLIDANDVTREPALRFTLKGEYLAVQKEDFTDKAVHMLSSRTGQILWRTSPKTPGLEFPMHSILIEGDRAYGLEEYSGVGFRVVSRECATGKPAYRVEEKGYAGDPVVSLLPGLYGSHLVVLAQDRQEFEVKAFDAKTGKREKTLQAKGAGEFGTPGRVSATVQNGRLVLLGKETLQF